jgi:hypothetical protein
MILRNCCIENTGIQYNNQTLLMLLSCRLLAIHFSPTREINEKVSYILIKRSILYNKMFFISYIRITVIYKKNNLHMANIMVFLSWHMKYMYSSVYNFNKNNYLCYSLKAGIANIPTSSSWRNKCFFINLTFSVWLYQKFTLYK